MKTRIIASVVLVPALLAVLLAAPKVLTALLFGVLAAIGAVEMLYGTGLVRHTRLVAYSALVAFLVSLWCFCGMQQVWWYILLLGFFTVLFVEMMISHIKLHIEKVSVCVVAGLLVPFLLSSLVRIIAMDNGRYFVMIPLVIGFLSDTGAYFIGCKFGRRKLAPVISPKKSIEGVFGGMAFAVLGMLIYGVVLQFGFHFRVHYGYAIVYGLLGSVCGVFGDLCFSVVKRQTGIKDYGKLIPGHGGVLDRFDSIIVVGPMVEILLTLLPVVVK